MKIESKDLISFVFNSFHIDFYRSSVPNLCMLEELDHETLRPKTTKFYLSNVSSLVSTRRKVSLNERITLELGATLVPLLMVP